MLRTAYEAKTDGDPEWKTKLREARVHWMATKRKYWADYVSKCVREKRHFALINFLARKGKMWVNYAPIGTSREKRPTVVDNVDHTIDTWRNFYNNIFRRDNLLQAPHINGLTEANSIPTF